MSKYHPVDPGCNSKIMPKRKKSQLCVSDVRYELYRKIALSFFAASILLFFVIFYFIYRRAVVKIIPNSEVANVEFIVDIKEKPTKETELAGRLTQITLDGEKEHLTQSETEEALTNVTGEITIINESNKAQALVATTRFLSGDGELFRLKNYAAIPSYSKVTAEIYADDPSTIVAEIAPGRFTIPGLSPSLQEKIYGETTDKIFPNTGKVKIIAESDINSAKEILLDELFKKSLIHFAKEVKSGERVLAKGVYREVLNFETDKGVGEKTLEFQEKMKAKFTAVLFNEDDLFIMAVKNLKEKIGGERKLAEFNKENLLYSVEKYDMEGGTANIKVAFTAKTSISENNKILERENMMGLTKEDVEAYLRAFSEIKDVEIKMVPSWWNRMPRIKNGIEVIIEN